MAKNIGSMESTPRSTRIVLYNILNSYIINAGMLLSATKIWSITTTLFLCFSSSLVTFRLTSGGDWRLGGACAHSWCGLGLGTELRYAWNCLVRACRCRISDDGDGTGGTRWRSLASGRRNDTRDTRDSNRR
jgi:hypothetical protein